MMLFYNVTNPFREAEEGTANKGTKIKENILFRTIGVENLQRKIITVRKDRMKEKNMNL